MKPLSWVLCIVLPIGLCAGLLSQATAGDHSFSREVLPILSDRCFHCHGPDDSTREAGLRLDVEDSAKEDLGGYSAVDPGNVEESELWRRITSDDEDELMPPPDSHRKPLSKSERDAIRRWIEAGAPWGKHWSFTRVERPDIPNPELHPIDAFVRDRLTRESLQPSPPASPHTQLRRLSFALTGLAPTVKEIRGFESDPTNEAWKRELNRLLKSPHYAERMAMWWLDAARYSDSDGFQQDATRENWPWRDWVIEAFASNMPFDQFTIEQFAGDLIPDASEEQLLATCFHRNHMTNGEGGRDREESRVDYVIDRVNTLGTVWLGLTLGCTQCHSHKFDPITQKDYYSLNAFFNSIDETGDAGKKAKPYLKYTSKQVNQSIEELEQFIAGCEKDVAERKLIAEQEFDSWLREQRRLERDSYQAWWTPKPARIASSEATTFEVDEAGVIQTFGPDTMHDNYRIELPIPEGLSRVSGWRVEVLPHESHVDGKFTRFGTGDFTLTVAKMLGKRSGNPAEVELSLAGAVADFEPDKKRKTAWDTRYTNVKETLNDDARDGWTTQSNEEIESHFAVYELSEPWQVESNDRLIVVLQQRSTHGHANIGRFRVSITSELGDTVRRADGGSPIQEWMASRDDDDEEKRRESRQKLLAQFLLGNPDYQAALRRSQQAKKQLNRLKGQAKPRSVMVLKERKDPRETHVLVRGVWDAKGDVVQRGVIPAVLDWPREKLQTRTDLAKWLIDRENPLTARVLANHLWQIMFGAGLVRTPEDFGLQGQLPTHPELLDWLAVELVESGWDVQHILRLIATSETFRQSSATNVELLEQDPDNRLLARAPKQRLHAWMLRDNALKVSGLLNAKVGGPPVYPYQPPGVWSEITMGRFRYEPSLGPAQYRRTIYAFWRRSSAPAFLFDSAQRRVCEVGVRSTNTPLHALTLMNHQTMLEASRALADAVPTSKTVKKGIQQLSMRVLGRRMVRDELGDLVRLHHRALAHFQTNLDSATEYVSVGQRPLVEESQVATVAAWMTVSNLLLNLDEAISYE